MKVIAVEWEDDKKKKRSVLKANEHILAYTFHTHSYDSDKGWSDHWLAMIGDRRIGRYATLLKAKESVERSLNAGTPVQAMNDPNRK